MIGRGELFGNENHAFVKHLSEHCLHINFIILEVCIVTTDESLLLGIAIIPSQTSSMVVGNYSLQIQTINLLSLQHSLLP